MLGDGRTVGLRGTLSARTASDAPAYGQAVAAGPLLRKCLESKSGARVMLLGGEAFETKRHAWWNFVSSSRERINQAKEDWREGRFPKVPGDEEEFIPLPDGAPKTVTYP